MRVVCEFCKTVYNIPDTKLVRDVSQATCKVCQNKILIRKPPEGTPVDELISAPGIPIPEPRAPVPTPTRISPTMGTLGDEMEPTVADPLPPPSSPAQKSALSNAPPSSSLSAPLPGEGSGLAQLPEQELSNSWREAIMDNRQTIAMLKKQGVSGPPDGSTASGPAVTGPAPAPVTARSASDGRDGMRGPPIGAVPAAPPVPFGSRPPAPPPPPFATPPAASLADLEPTVAQDGPGPTSASAPAPTPKLANAPPPPAAENEKPLELATGRTAGTITNVQSMPSNVPSSRVASPPRPFIQEGSSRLLSFGTGVAASAIVAAQIWNGSWGAGLSGWLAFGAASFVASAGLLNSLLRGPGMLAVFGVGSFSALVAIGAMLGVFLTGGARTRVIAEAHPFLAPLAAYEMHLAKGPDVAPEPTETPVAATSPVEPEPSAAPSATP